MKKILISTLAFILVICTVILVIFLPKKDNRTREDKIAAFAAENPDLKKGQTVFIGDSITEKYPLKRHFRGSELECYNRGISGDTTDWLLTRIQISLFDLAPSKVVLMIGTNDINAGKDADEIIKNYELLLDQISNKLPNAEVFCVSVIPQNEKHSSDAERNNQRIIKTNELIQELARSYGYTYVDLYNSLTDKDGLLVRGYSNDGLHLNRRGYKVWTSVMKEILK